MTRQNHQDRHLARHAHRRNAGALAALALVAIGVVSLPVDRAEAVTNGTIGIRPAAESDFFHLSLYPGAATEAVAIVSNQSAEPVTLLVYPVDGEGTPQGTFAFGSQTDVPSGVGSWVALAAEEVTIPARSELPVPFTVSVPEGTPPGDYAGGLIIQPPPVEGETTDLGDGTAVRLDVVQRQGLRIYLDVAGTAVQKIDFGELTWAKAGETLRFSLPLQNMGNTTLHPSGAVAIAGGLGDGRSVKFDAPESILPGGSFTMVAELRDAPAFQWGTAEATVTSEAGGAHTVVDLVYMPAELPVAAAVILAVLGVLILRAARFVRRARRALARVELADSRARA